MFRGGQPIAAWINDQIAPGKRGPYTALVHRGEDGPDWDFYPLPLRQRLPAIRLPLRPTDAPVVLDLQPHIDRAYANGRYPIDYSKNLELSLDPPDAAWADGLLRAAGKRHVAIQ